MRHFQFFVFICLLFCGDCKDECFTHAVLKLTRSINSVEKIETDILLNAKTLVETTNSAIRTLDKVEPAFKAALEVGKAQAAPAHSDFIMTSSRHDFYLLKAKATAALAHTKCWEDKLHLFDPSLQGSELKELGKILKAREPPVTLVLIETEALTNAVSSQKGVLLAQLSAPLNEKNLNNFNNYPSSYDFTSTAIATTEGVSATFDIICQRPKHAKVFSKTFLKSFEASTSVFLKELKGLKDKMETFAKMPSAAASFIESPFDDMYNITLDNSIMANILKLQDLTHSQNWLNIDPQDLLDLEHLVKSLTDNFFSQDNWFNLHLNDVEKFRTFLGWSKERLIEPDIKFKPKKITKPAENTHFCLGTVEVKVVSKLPKLKEFWVVSKVIDGKVLKPRYLIRNNDIEFSSLYGLRNLKCIRNNVCYMPDHKMVQYQDKRCAKYITSLNVVSADKKFCEFTPLKALESHRIDCPQTNAIINSPITKQISVVCNLTNSKQVTLPVGTSQFSSACAFKQNNVELLKTLPNIVQQLPDSLALFNENKVDYTTMYAIIGSVSGFSLMLSITIAILCIRLGCSKCCKSNCCKSKCSRQKKNKSKHKNVSGGEDFELELMVDENQGPRNISRRNSISLRSRQPSMHMQPPNNPNFPVQADAPPIELAENQ